MQEIEQRVTKLEGQMEAVRDDVSEIKYQLNQTAKKADLEELQKHIDYRDRLYTNNMWRLVFGLVVILAALLATSFGVRDIPAIFG